MKSLSLLFQVWFLVANAFHPVAVKQEAAVPQDSWLTRAQYFTDVSLKDALLLTAFDRALLWARLGELWWEADPSKAQEWFKKSVEALEYAPQSQRRSERDRQLSAGGKVLQILAPKAPALADRLAAMLVLPSKAGEGEAGGPGSRANPDDLIYAAQSIAESDPSRAVQLGEASLRAGSSYNLYALLIDLQRRDAASARLLLIKVMEEAKVKYDVVLLAVLEGFALRRTPESESRLARIPAEVRSQILRLLAEAVVQSAAPPSAKEEICRRVPYIAPYIGELPPDQLSAVRAAIVSCQQHLSSGLQRTVTNALQNVPLKTVEDYELAANEASDPGTKAWYLVRASSLAAQEKDFERQIAILDSIDAGERAKLQGWSAVRWMAATNAALARLKASEFSSMRRIIESTPKEIRAFVQVNVAEGLMGTEDIVGALELLADARRSFANAGSETREQELYTQEYYSLVGLYARLKRPEALEVFREVVAYLNHFRPEEGSERQDSRTNDKLDFWPPEIPAQLIESDEIGLASSVASIDSPLKRVPVELGLVKTSLQELKRLSSHSEKQHPTHNKPKP